MLDKRAEFVLRSQSLPELMAMVDRGVITINELREVLELPPLAGGDRAFVVTPQGVVPVDDFQTYNQ